MLPPGFFAVAVGIAVFVLIAAVSMRGARRKRRAARDGGAITPLDDPNDDFGDGK